MKLKFPFKKTVRKWIQLRQVRPYFRGWKLSAERLHMIQCQYAEWLHYYLPVPLYGKVVLDVGAGEGETAAFFLQHGAREVVAVECDPKCERNLRVNASSHPLRLVLAPFNVRMLSIPHDFLKVDIEGWEELLLPSSPSSLRPAVVEVHGNQMRQHFLDRGWLGMKELNLVSPGSFVTNVGGGGV